ncbi:MAG: C10 family peptidase [Muribaculaceae bacterium]
MKSKFLFLLSLWLLVSCDDTSNFYNVFDENNQQKVLINSDSGRSNYNLSAETVLKYLSKRNKSAIIVFKPMIDGSDTLAFYVEYERGWEIVAADKRLSPVIMKADSGCIDFSKNDMQIDCMLRYIKKIKTDNNSNDTINRVWEFFDLPSLKHKVKTRGYGQGMWIAQDTIIDESTEAFPRIVSTQWGQLYPWNSFTKIENGEKCCVGCGPVAVGQVIYHFRKNNPRDCQVPTSAYYPDGSEYPQFMTFSATGWSDMAESINSLSGHNYTAMFLAKLGIDMGVDYGLNATSVTATQMGDSLRAYKLKYNHSITYDFESIYSNLQAEKPIIVCASSSSGAHAFIINGYAKECVIARISYVWDSEHHVTEWEFDHYDQSMFMNDKGSDTKEEEINISENVYFGMNWGYSGYYDNRLYNVSYTNFAFIEDGTIVREYNSVVYAPYWACGDVIYNSVNHIFYNIQEENL